jgi:hypothetical protein
MRSILTARSGYSSKTYTRCAPADGQNVILFAIVITTTDYLPLINLSQLCAGYNKSLKNAKRSSEETTEMPLFLVM